MSLDDPTQPYHMIQNKNHVHYHNLGTWLQIHPTQKFKQPHQKITGTQKPHHRISSAFHITLPWLLTTLTSQILPPGLGHFQVILILRVLPISLDPNPTLPHDSEHKMCASPQPYRHWDYRFTQDTKFKQPPHKITRRPKSNYRIKRAFQITLLWCHHIEQQKSLPDLNNEATSYNSRHKKERYSTNTRFKCKSAWIISTQTWNRLVGCNAM